MDEFAPRRLAVAPDAIAPDGSEVRLLGATAGGSMAMFTLPPLAVARAVAHRTVDEIWYVVAGSGRLWRRIGEREDVAALAPGVSVTIPCGARFQFRNDGEAPLDIVAVTLPPWPGEDEAQPAEGPWAASR
jgi:mannose-6-phosphate isomerase-like protein (cupin superfamily)